MKISFDIDLLDNGLNKLLTDRDICVERLKEFFGFVFTPYPVFFFFASRRGNFKEKVVKHP